MTPPERAWSIGFKDIHGPAPSGEGGVHFDQLLRVKDHVVCLLEPMDSFAYCLQFPYGLLSSAYSVELFPFFSPR